MFTNRARRIDVEVEIEDGAPSERVRERTDDDRSLNGIRDDDGVEPDRCDDDDDDRIRSADDHRSGHDDDDDDDRSERDHPDDD